MSPTIDPNPFSAPNSGEPPPEPGAQREVEFLAERSTRLVGSMLDAFLYLLAAIPGFVVMGVLSESTKNIFESPAVLGTIGLPELCLVGYQWYLVSTTGQSLAKKWLKMKVVKMDGSDVDFVSGVIMRVWIVQAMAMLPMVGGFIGLIDAVMIFSDDRRCLHDRIAGTKVIMTIDR